jgi:fructose-1,6-bisphosphatase I
MNDATEHHVETGDVVAAVVETVARTAPDVRRGLIGRRSYEATENESGERQLAADVYANELLEERIGAIDGVGEYASEEREEIVRTGEGVSVAVDPLDGSSNLRSNNAMGTIFSVYDDALPAKGETLLAAGFVLYGPITSMTVARDGAVTEYEIVDGEMHASERDVTLPEDPLVYGFGGRRPDWPDAFEAYATEIEHELKLRYGGAMIADVNQALEYGGVFAYPGLRSRPEGKLRLQFEGNPIGYVVECAGGASSDGGRSLLEVEPTEGVHQRVPVHVGNESLIERLEDALE